MKRLDEKLRDRRGVSRIIVILAVLVLVMAVAIAVPQVQEVFRQSEAVGCGSAMDSAARRIAEDYLGGNTNPTPQQLKDVVDRAMIGFDELCPAGGNVYLVPQEGKEPPFRLVCGKHDGDAKLRTRLNAEHVRNEAREALLERKKAGEPLPESLTVELGHKDLTVERVAEPVRLTRGTGTTEGYEGTVAFFMAEDGELSYLAFADELHCAIWQKDHEWSGDSYNRLT